MKTMTRKTKHGQISLPLGKQMTLPESRGASGSKRSATLPNEGIRRCLCPAVDVFQLLMIMMMMMKQWPSSGTAITNKLIPFSIPSSPNTQIHCNNVLNSLHNNSHSRNISEQWSKCQLNFITKLD